MAMGNWKTKKQKHNSHTPGRAKGENCKADGVKKYYMCNPRAVRDKDYSYWHRKAMALNGVK